MTETPLAQTPAAAALPQGRLARGVLRLYAALHALAERGWAATAIGTWSFLQGALVPGPVDTLLVPLGLADQPKAYRFAWAAVVGSVLGATAAYAAGALAYDTVGAWVLGLFDAHGNIDVWRARFQGHGWWVVFISTVTPVSSKLVSVAAGAFGVPLWEFAAAMFVGRLLRFMTVAFVVQRFGRGIDRWIARRYGTTLDELAMSVRRAGPPAA